MSLISTDGHLKITLLHTRLLTLRLLVWVLRLSLIRLVTGSKPTASGRRMRTAVVGYVCLPPHYRHRVSVRLMRGPLTYTAIQLPQCSRKIPVGQLCQI